MSIVTQRSPISATADHLLKLPIIYTIQQYHMIFLLMKELTPEATAYMPSIILFLKMIYESIFFSARIDNIWNTACLIRLLMLALLMHLKHGWISFDRTKQLNLILQPI